MQGSCPIAKRFRKTARECVPLSINPISVKNTTISPNVLATAVNVVVYKVAFERALVCPDELAFALLFTIHVFTTVLGTVGPFFHTLTVLLVV